MRIPRLKPLGYVVVLTFLGGLLWLIAGLVDRTRMEAILYDLTHSNPYVDQRSQVRAILEGFERVSPEDLPKAFRSRTGMNKRAFKDLYHGREFFVVKKQDLYRKIAGHNRLMAMVSADNGYRRHSLWSGQAFYVYIDRKVIYLLLDIQEAVSKSGLDRDGIRVISGHRTPGHNSSVGGKKESRHLLGDALDLMIGDVNGDGQADRTDKKLLIPILNRLVGSNGGLGIYARSVHIDVRGKRARW
ncbi:MAG: D-Ala-D-Ala carboxypeptidase family metallohydrolase [Bacteroidota bacterium]